MKKIFKCAICAIVGLIACTSCTENPVDIKVISYNIRLSTKSDGDNWWENRKQASINMINEEKPTVFGLQEALPVQVEYLAENLPEYAYIGVGRDDGQQRGEYSPLFFKKDRFDVLDSNTFWLSQYPDSVGFVGWDGACCRIATWAKLKDKKNGQVFMAVNTHFDHVGVEAQKNGALLIIDKIKEIVGDQPAVLTGDFNVTDDSEAYATITSNEFVLKDAQKIAKTVEGVSHTYHGFGKIPAEKCKKIDFIFVTPQIQVERSFIPANVEGQPGKNLSDHNPQIVKVTF